MKPRDFVACKAIITAIAATLLTGCYSPSSDRAAYKKPAQQAGAPYYEDGYAEADYYRGTTYGFPGYVDGEDYSGSRVQSTGGDAADLSHAIHSP
jgi:hypothetical protein